MRCPCRSPVPVRAYHLHGCLDAALVPWRHHNHFPIPTLLCRHRTRRQPSCFMVMSKPIRSARALPAALVPRDAAFFEWLEINMERLLARDPEAIAYAVERSCINKVRADVWPPGR